MSGDHIRAFIAVDIGAGLREKLGAIQSDLRHADADVKWVAPEGIHLTFVFFPGISLEHAGLACESLSRIASETESFPVEIAGSGFFGARRAPRVIWVGVKADARLGKMQARVCSELKAWQVPFDDKPFKPHLTLGRVRSPRGAPSLLKALEPLQERHFGMVHVADLLFIKSTLTPAGPIYECLQKAALKPEVPRHGSA